VRGNKKFTPEQRMEQTMQMWERCAGQLLRRPVCLAGNITDRDLGFDQPTLQWVSDNCGSIIHSAASLAFHARGAEPWRTNVEGTQCVLDLCEQTQIGHMHYISTAYTCGQRTDLVMEDGLDVGQKFRNDYEKSKFEAEKRVRKSDFFDCTTIYRPVVITGDSVTGYTSTYHGTYLYMRMAKLLASNVEPDENGLRHVPVRWGLKGNERRNITPVDWNSEVICQLFENEQAHGMTFHLAPDQPMTMRDAIEYASKFYGLTGIEFAGYGTNPDKPLNDLEKWIWANISIYGSYDFMDPEFDRTNLQMFAPPPCPRLDYTNAKRLLEYAEQDCWGKRQPGRPQPPILCVESYLASCLQDVPAEDSLTIGIEALGPGGGPWTLTLAGSALASFQRGLPLVETGAPTVQIPTTSLERIQDAPAQAVSILCDTTELQGGARPDLAERLASALSVAVAT
jgi:nucleoside-diphosphate-sugar epimerase